MSKKEREQAMHIRRTAGDWAVDIAIITVFVLFTIIFRENRAK